MQLLFWGSVFLVAYPYTAYPLLVMCWGALRPRIIRRAPFETSVTVLIPAYNEARALAKTLDAMLAQDYPIQKIQILVVSDASDDGTDEIVRSYSHKGVSLLRQSQRGGKALALNAAVRQAMGDIIVFSDANSRFAPDAVRNLVMNFADPDVGYATGSLGLSSDSPSVSGAGISAYMLYETFLRIRESRVGSVIGVNGGCDAIRRSLYSDIPGDLITDFVLPLRVIAAGHRVVFDPQARSFEESNSELRSEFGMRSRVALRALQGLMHMRQLLNPLRFPGVAFCILSHKVLRYLAFVFVVIALFTNLALAVDSSFYRFVLFAQLLWYALGVWGIAATPRARKIRLLTSIPAYLMMVYAAFALASFRFLRGRSMATWQPRAG